LRRYLKWARAAGHVSDVDDEATRRVLEQFEVLVKRDLDNLEKALEGLRAEEGIEIFPLSEAMLERSLSLSTETLDLKPFDNAILAAILVRADELAKEGRLDMAFCELDGDTLKKLYDNAHVWVYGDFTMTTPEPPPDW
jgi:hypothetical protein